ncbi:sensor domain-containing phosphodiesterase [Actinoplanes bogorensis]|uniref:Sensor domain-containing phosphodiesterase n=1 Tax=Paractinoplanes bogorensis TaxID=1610840 RepID=A0ABS5Z4C0_9ACTN|nr:sensor domain-containing phosphodiesterase [Actinoplanes bogorensis]MBU2670520.1 sensor domain-containing phosphodiesterase [Actinoplanes bogorensis]
MAAPEEHQRVPAPRAPIDDRPAWFSYTASGDRIVWSPALRAMLGHPPAQDEVSRKVLARYVHRDDHAAALAAITKLWATRAQVRTTIRLMRDDGGWFDVDCRLDPMKSPDGTVRGIRGTVTDVSARERARREMDRLVRRGETVRASLIEPDPATGLLTRARFADEIDRAQRRGGGAVLVIRVQPAPAGPDLDDLRLERNADLLHRAARVLEGVMQQGALLGRVGPNEIGILLPGTSWPMARREADLLVEALRAQTFVLPDTWLRARAWGGLVRFTPDGDAGSHELLIDAEHAWRQSRDGDGSLTLVAHPVPARDRQGSYRSRVADALDTDRFTLYAQPILELQTNEVTRHELLLRVLDEADGPQSPIQVLDIAERLDAVFDIDLWVVERAMQLAADQPGACLQINLSGRSVGDPRLTDEVERLIEQYRVKPEQLTFEITETALIGNLSEARRFADRVRDLGCELALDDFGSGYASFRYLRIFPIDLVKIDGEYVVDLVNSPQDQVLVRALVQVCQAYGIHTVAEFVQDEPTLRLLRELGVDYVQGYLIGRPAPVVHAFSG